jgi:hypothetical protein
MRLLAFLPLALLTTGCLAPGERDPARYPWDPRNAARHPPLVARGAIPPLAVPPQRFAPPPGTYCVVVLEPPSSSGIVSGGKAPGIMACSTPIAPASAWKKQR